MPTPMLLLIAVVLGWLVQLYLSYQQSMSFNDDVRRLRPRGTVSVGAGGKRYRGGRAFVAVAFDDRGVVADGIVLSGFSTFARSKPLATVVGRKVNQLAGDREIPGLSAPQREAVRQAAELYRTGSAHETVQPVMR